MSVSLFRMQNFALFASLFISSSFCVIAAQNTSSTVTPVPAKNTTVPAETGRNVTTLPTTNATVSKAPKAPDHPHQAFNRNASFLSLMTDSSPLGAKVIAEVVNYELSAAAYTVYLTNCSSDFPSEQIELEPAVDTSLPHITTLRAAKSHVFLIPPLRTRTFMIDLNFHNMSHKLTTKASCIISIYNRYNEQLRRKLIDFSPGDTCICASNCSCGCVKEDPFLICHLIDDEAVVAGWLASLKGNTEKDLGKSQNGTEGNKGILPGSDGKGGEEPLRGWNSEFSDSIRDLEDGHMEYLNLMLLIIVILILLLLGTCKGLWGICCFPVGRCCLRRFYDKPRILNKYYEPKLSNYTPVHDSGGYPLNPFTKKRTVKRLNPIVAFFLNVIFFLCFPFFCLVWLRHCISNEEDYAGFDSDDDGYGGSKRLSTVEERKRRKSLDDSRDGPSEPRHSVRVPVISDGPEERQTYSAELSSDEDAPELYDDEVNDGPEEDEDANTINAFHHSEPNVQQDYIAGHAQLYQDLSPIVSSTPLPNSSTLLRNLTREPQTDIAEPRGDRPLQVCCGTAAYGSWHRTPAIFGNVYDGDSRFDMHKTLEMTRRRRTGENQGGHLLD